MVEERNNNSRLEKRAISEQPVLDENEPGPITLEELYPSIKKYREGIREWERKSRYSSTRSGGSELVY